MVVGFYQGVIRTMMEYGSFIYGARASRSLLGKLDGIQKKALMKCLHVGVSIPLEVLEVEAQVEPLSIRRLAQAKWYLDRAIAQPRNMRLGLFKDKDTSLGGAGRLVCRRKLQLSGREMKEKDFLSAG